MKSHINKMIIYFSVVMNVSEQLSRSANRKSLLFYRRNLETGVSEKREEDEAWATRKIHENEIFLK